MQLIGQSEKMVDAEMTAECSLTAVHINTAFTEVGAPLPRVLIGGDCHHLVGLLVASHAWRRQCEVWQKLLLLRMEKSKGRIWER